MTSGPEEGRKTTSMKPASFVFALVFLALGPTPRSAAAATASTSFGVIATVQDNCLVSLSAVRLGNYFGAIANATAPVSVNCTHSTPYNVVLSAGLATGAMVAVRKANGPSPTLLGYALLGSSQGSINRGQPVGPATVAGTGIGPALAFSLHDLISAGQYDAAATYVIVTVTY